MLKILKPLYTQGDYYVNTAMLLDVDNCLITSTMRDMPQERVDILWGLHDALDGAIALVTNSDMRGIDEMIEGFPCVSEHAAVYRLKVKSIAESMVTPVDTDALIDTVPFMADHMGVATTKSSDILNGSAPVLKIEAKQTSVALVFGRHAGLKQAAIDIASQIVYLNEPELANYEVVTGIDAVEIRPKGFEKYQALDKILQHPNFKDRHVHVYGDSSPDAKLMQAAFERANGRGFAVGDAPCFMGQPFVAQQFETMDDNWVHLAEKLDSFREQRCQFKSLTKG